MTEHGRRTQQTYDAVAADFLERHGDRSVLRPWMQRFKTHVQAGGVVLDLGAGPCFDSSELRALGLRVVSVDRSRGMLTVARARFPGPRVQADIRCLPFVAGCASGVWASASLLHLDRRELVPALAGVRAVLAPSGVLFLSLKHGDGERWDSSMYSPDLPRWFTYYDEPEVDGALAATGFEIVESESRAGSRDRWIMRIARAC